MKQLKKFNILLLTIILLAASACGIPTGSGIPEPVEPSIDVTETPNFEINKSKMQVTSISATDYIVHNLEDYLDIDKTFCIGYDETLNSIIYFERGEQENIIWGVNIDSKETAQLIELPIEPGQYYFGIIYSDGWIVWTEHADRDVYIGLSTGANWKLRAANINTGEIIEIDESDDSFPSDLFATPWGITCNGEYAAYCGYDTDLEGNLYCVVKAYDFANHELITIASYPTNGVQVFDDPCLGDGFVAYAAFFNIGDGDFTSSVYYYDLASRELTELQSNGNLSSVAVAGDHIIAFEQDIDEQGIRANKSIAVYNDGVWQTLIDHSSPMYSAVGDEYMSFDALETWGNYVSWRNVIYNGYYIYDIVSNSILELISQESEDLYAGGVNFNSPFLCWSEYSPNTDETTMNFIILEQTD